MQVTVILPSFNPDEQLISVVEGLLSAGLTDIVVVNDGSAADHAVHFQALTRFSGVTVLSHPVNLGKGQALKTGFAYVLEHRPDSVGVVTADGDGQHRPQDVRAVAEALQADPGRVYLGVRDFDRPQVPGRSRFGNKVSCATMNLLYGLRLRDTQTGLRGLPRETLDQFIAVSGSRFEYETNMLLELRQQRIPYAEIPIETVYTPRNESSHFRPVRDSLRIYWLLLRRFIRFAGCSLLCFGLDILLFTVFGQVLFKGLNMAAQVFAATALARLFSSLCNFLINRRAVFRSSRPLKAALWRYYLLCAGQVVCSALLVFLLDIALPIPRTVIKCVVDTSLFLVSYRIQQRLVFCR